MEAAYRVLGIDPGSRLCGYGVLEVRPPRSCQYVECGVLRAPKAESMEMRLGAIAKWLIEIIEEFQPDEIALEDVFAYKNVRSALALAQARGTVLAVAGMANIVVHSYPPTVVKQAVTGRGAAPKEQIARMVQATVGLKSQPPADAADALAVALTHTQRRGR